MKMTWHRTVAVGSSASLSETWTTPLRREQREALLNATFPHTGNVSIPIPGLLAKFVRLPSTSNAHATLLHGAQDEWHTFQNLTLVRFVAPSSNGGELQQWWAMHQTEHDSSPFKTRVSDGIQMVVVADKAVTVSELFAAGGVLAFYAAVVLAIGRTVRSIIGGTRYQLIVDEMPDTRDLFDLCEGVYLARHAGQLLRETELHDTILRLYRSPETLLQLTGGQLKRRGE